MPKIAAQPLLQRLQDLQFLHTKQGLKKWVDDQKTERAKSPKRKGGFRNFNSSPNSNGSAERKKLVGELDEVDDLPGSAMGPRPMTAPLRPNTPLLSPKLLESFDSTAPRPWTSHEIRDKSNNDHNDPNSKLNSHIRLGKLVQTSIDHIDIAKNVVEDATGCQLKDSRKVFQGLAES